MFLFVLLLLLGGARPTPAALPARPVPFRFVTDEAHLLSAAAARSLENGLRRYADQTGPQVVVVTVPTLGGRAVADYARGLGQSWRLGQPGKDNGVVVLVAAQEHEVSIQAGRGLRAVVTPALTSRIISEQLTPGFRQGRYFDGLRAGLNILLKALEQHPDAGSPAAAPAPTPALTPGPEPEPTPSVAPAPAAPAVPDAAPADPYAAPPAPADTPGPGFGLLVVGVLILGIGGVIWLGLRLLRRRAGPPPAAPDFLPPTPGSRSRRPGPDFQSGPGGSGLGGALLTGAAAAAGAYLGTRMAAPDAPTPGSLGTTAPPPPTSGGSATGEFPALGGGPAEPGPDYFADDADPAAGAPDYFSSEEPPASADPASDDPGGGGFDDDNPNSGEW